MSYNNRGASVDQWLSDLENDYLAHIPVVLVEIQLIPTLENNKGLS